jgi:hypothetical protein
MTTSPTFLWDEENTAHLEEGHPEITPDDVDSIFQHRTVRLDNTRGRPGRLFLGIDHRSDFWQFPPFPSAVTSGSQRQPTRRDPPGNERPTRTVHNN